MKRISACLGLALLLSVSSVQSASNTTWSRAGRTVIVKTFDGGRKLLVMYTRRPGETSVQPGLRACVDDRKKAYLEVTCRVYDSLERLNYVQDEVQGRICYFWSLTFWPSGKYDFQDNPALQLVRQCGGKLHLP